MFKDSHSKSLAFNLKKEEQLYLKLRRVKIKRFSESKGNEIF